MEENSSFLATAPVGKLMRKYSIPCIISLLVAALYNIVDQIFISNASYLGSYGNSANTVVYPLTVIALALAVCIGDGCCAFSSSLLGAGDGKKASRCLQNALEMTLLVAVAVCAAYLLFGNALITAFGGTVSEKTFELSQEYLFWIALGIPFYVFGQAMNPIIRADGSPRFAMVSTLAGAVLNIILDPIFIYACKWGMAGAAIATVLGQIVTAVLAVWYLFHLKVLKFDRSAWAPDWAVIRRTLALGLTSFLSQISLVVAMMAINNMIRKYSGLDEIFSQAEYSHIPMAVVGIVMKFFQIIISIVVGMAAGCIPVVGFNMGASRPGRVRQLFTRLLVSEAIVGAVGWIIVEFFPQLVLDLFGAAGESEYYTSFGLRAFRIYLCMMIPACINKASFIFLQAMGKALSATAISMIREIVFGAGFALLLPRLFGLGLDGVLWSMPLSDILTLILAVIVIIRTYRQLKQMEQSNLKTTL